MRQTQSSNKQYLEPSRSSFSNARKNIAVRHNIIYQDVISLLRIVEPHANAKSMLSLRSQVGLLESWVVEMKANKLLWPLIPRVIKHQRHIKHLQFISLIASSSPLPDVRL
jgi:hypothetical protein